MNEHPQKHGRWRSLLRMASFRVIVAGTIVLVCALALLLFLDPLVNKYVKPRITEKFAATYPAYSLHVGDMGYSVLMNRFTIEAVDLRRVDGTLSSTLDRFSVSGITWVHLLWGGKLTLKDFAEAGIDAQDVKLSLPQSHYEFYCRTLRLSVPDSELIVNAFKLYPLDNDEKFFAQSELRRTRFQLIVPYAKANGMACFEMVQQKRYAMRSVQLHDPQLDVLVNKDKPYGGIPPLMPNELLFSVKESLKVSRLNIINGVLKYGERMRLGSLPGVITFDSIQALVEGIANHVNRDAALVVHARAKFMKSGTMTVLMSIPVAMPQFSYQYSGSLSRMNLEALNAFLEEGEHMRIKRGILEEASFGITVVSGRASGTVRAVYRDLTFAVINKYTSSEKGIFDRLSSFIANNFKFRRNNVPGKSGAMKIGVVNYTRQRDNYFFEFTWLALRSGVGNVVGF